MGKIVVVAEKPSVGRDIAKVIGCKERGDGCLIGEKYIVTWAIGHLVALAEPDEIDEKYKKWSFSTLPILPSEIPLKVINSTKAQFNNVKKLINDKKTDSLICATDAGREGELIFRYIYQKAACKKPFSRLWISSMTDEAISEGFHNIRPGSEYDGLFFSAQCRSKADWLVGMNASRAFTLKYDTLLSIGRVQTPTLAILVQRKKEIERFKAKSFWIVQADFGDYTGVCFNSQWDPDTHITQREKAESISNRIKGETAVIIQAETVRKRELPPQLYDLTSLQRDANRLLGFTAEKTLKTAQSLYETHKALTYPRTDSRYLPPDMIPRTIQTIKLLPQEYQVYVPQALPNGKLPVSRRTIDETKVTDHHAIIPTAKRVDLARFNMDERKLFDLVARRLLTAFYPACEFDSTRVITRVTDLTFRTTGKAIITNGWHDIPATEIPSKKKKEEEEEKTLPLLNVGDKRTVHECKIREDMTKPPVPHTDASLLSAMETAGKDLDDEELAKEMKGSGIGTPATRAAIIERLIKVKYVQRKGKNLLATEKGVRLIEIMPSEIASPELTGKWELALHRITDGEQDADQFMEGIRCMCSSLVDYAKTNNTSVTFAKEESEKKGKRIKSNNQGTILEETTCPICGKGKMWESPLAFNCSEKECSCTIWKDCLEKGGGPILTAKLIRMILDRRTIQGSTGTIIIQEGKIQFYPTGSKLASVNRSLIYKKRV